MTTNKSFSVSVPHAGPSSNEEGLPGRACLSPSVAMATPYFPTFLLLIFLSSFTLLLLTLLPSVSPSLPSSSSSSPWPSPSCGLSQAWAVRLQVSAHHEDDDDEGQNSLHLDAIASRVKCFLHIHFLHALRMQLPD